MSVWLTVCCFSSYLQLTNTGLARGTHAVDVMTVAEVGRPNSGDSEFDQSLMNAQRGCECGSDSHQVMSLGDTQLLFGVHPAIVISFFFFAMTPYANLPLLNLRSPIFGLTPIA